MKSFEIEFFRLGNHETGVLRGGESYILAMGSRPVRPVSLPDIFDSKKSPLKPLRYEKGEDEKARLAAVDTLGKEIQKILCLGSFDEARDGSFVHVDLVTNPAELAMLPFELIQDLGSPEGDEPPHPPLLVRKKGVAIELTRRVRTDSDAVDKPWPVKPRVLLVAAAPGKDVPFDTHRAALLRALDPWLPKFMPDKNRDEFLVVLEVATIGKIRDACERAMSEKNPFTHVHVLAHGTTIDDGAHRRFGVALHDQYDDLVTHAASPEELVDALRPLAGEPVVITLAVCDSANMENSAIPEKSVTHALHVSGFPVVLASQLPLTVRGSEMLVETFYASLFLGKDVRVALHEARCALHDNRVATHHDWASLTAYVRLPQRYEEYLAETRLSSALASMKATRELSDTRAKNEGESRVLADEVERRLVDDIRRLQQYPADPLTKRVPKLVAEAVGLLASGEKRLAEHYHSLGPDAATRSKLALENAWGWYRRGHGDQLSAHWLGTQALSLEAAITGSVKSLSRWHAALAAAEIDGEKPDEYWAFGSLAELWLIASKIEGLYAPAPLATAKNHVETLTHRARALMQSASQDPKLAANVQFALESTRHQLERYANWWTKKNGFFPNTKTDLAAEATELLSVL